MSWLFELKIRHSAKNGRIVCRRLFGRWEVFVDYLHMSSRYLRANWKRAYGKLPAAFAPRKVLMLGLAAGDSVTLLEDRFPGCRITAVEWDPEMVRLADELGLFPRTSRPEVLIADAAEAVRMLAGPYDLILVDIFTDTEVSRAAFSTGFFGQVSRLLPSDGYAIVNAYRQQELLDVAAADLDHADSWIWRYNRMGIFRKKRSTIT